QPGIEIDPRRRVQRQLRQPRGERTLTQDPLRQLAHANLQLPGRGDRRHEPDLERLLRVDDVAGQHEVLGPSETDDARQPLRRAGAGYDAEPELWLPERRGLRRDADVARERQLAPAAERVPVDRGDRGAW